eukprot:scaffold86532_cov67-Phaeocystis_antarctica.AAC.2
MAVWVAHRNAAQCATLLLRHMAWRRAAGALPPCVAGCDHRRPRQARPQATARAACEARAGGDGATAGAAELGGQCPVRAAGGGAAGRQAPPHGALAGGVFGAQGTRGAGTARGGAADGVRQSAGAGRVGGGHGLGGGGAAACEACGGADA